MTREATAMLRTRRGLPIPLTGVTLAGLVDGCLFELAVEQRYVNREAEAIEAVYTFPLPLNAVLLSFELEIGERRLAGVVSRKAAATERYETAIESGDTAALLERASDGLYTVSLGNLKAGEEAVIRYRYAELLEFDAGRVRIAIPTAVAPRYGNPAVAVEAHQTPAVDLTAHYPLGFTLTVRGELARARIESPTHALIEVASGAETTFTTRSGGALDRDLIVLIQGIESTSLAVVEPDGEGWVVLASLAIPAATAEPHRPKALKIVVDCSLSMAGDSIRQARDAVLATLATLTGEDHVSLTRFGANYEHLTQGVRPFIPSVALELNDKVRALDANLGGTEIERALEAAIALPVPAGAGADMLLITDGETWNLDPVIRRAASSGHRLFVIAVGASPNEALARRIASVTGGACEFVTPLEDMSAAVRRLIAKISTASQRLGTVRWPAVPSWTVGTDQTVFPGTTCHVFAGFDVLPSGAVELSMQAPGAADSLRVQLPSHAASGKTLARVAAMQRLAALDGEEAAALAEQYQLVTAYTSCAVVLERAADDKQTASPQLRVVPQMLAAGWGGAGVMLSAPPPARSASFPDRPAGRPRADYASLDAKAPASGGDSLDVPAFLARPAPDAEGIDRVVTGRSNWLQRLATFSSSGRWPRSLNELRPFKVPEHILEKLRALIAEGLDEAEVVTAWLAVLASGPDANRFGSPGRERIERAADAKIRVRVAQSFGIGQPPAAENPPPADAGTGGRAEPGLMSRLRQHWLGHQ